MAPMTVTMKNAPSGRRLVRSGSARYELSDPANLSTASNRPEAQSVIREGIHQGIVRVVPIPGCPTHVRVVRVQPGPSGPIASHHLEV